MHSTVKCVVFSLSTIHWAKCATIWWDWCCFANQFPRCPWLLHTPLLGGQWFALLRPCIAGFRCFLDSLRGCKQDYRYLNSHSEHLFRGGFVHSWCVLGRAKGLLQSKKSTKGIRCCLRYRCSLRYKMVSIAQGSIWARKGHGPREFYGFPQIFQLPPPTSSAWDPFRCINCLGILLDNALGYIFAGSGGVRPAGMGTKNYGFSTCVVLVLQQFSHGSIGSMFWKLTQIVILMDYHV